MNNLEKTNQKNEYKEKKNNGWTDKPNDWNQSKKHQLTNKQWWKTINELAMNIKNQVEYIPREWLQNKRQVTQLATESRCDKEGKTTK